MNKKLSIVLKGLLVALVVIVSGGIVSLKLNTNINNPEMVLISTSLINTLKIDSESSEEIQENNIEVVEIETDLDLKELNIPEKKSEEKVKEELKEENKEKIEEKVREEVIEKNETSNNDSTKENGNTPIEEPAPAVYEEPKEDKKPEIPINGSYTPNLTVASTITPLATYTGRITAYGPDCYGCTSGRTASGQYVLEGNIYYNDATFGNIRIVAADKSIPFGSIVKISGLNISSDPILAIVLDRGGAIGFAEGKHAYFDLLYKSEADTISFGRPTATFDILRNGY